MEMCSIRTDEEFALENIIVAVVVAIVTVVAKDVVASVFINV